MQLLVFLRLLIDNAAAHESAGAVHLVQVNDLCRPIPIRVVGRFPVVAVGHLRRVRCSRRRRFGWIVWVRVTSCNHVWWAEA